MCIICDALFPEKGGCEYAWYWILKMFHKDEKEKKWKKRDEKIDGMGRRWVG
jgi:hypothetical protein